VAKVTGATAHLRRLARIRGPQMVRGVTRALYAAAQDIQVDAQISISTGAVSGKNHAPSAPGEPPNNDTGVLAGNIEAAATGPLKAEVSSNAPYAVIHEFGGTAGKGGSVMLPERPYMRPAAAKNRPNALKRVNAAVNKVLAAGG
jgi:phage gpG-like protein